MYRVALKVSISIPSLVVIGEIRPRRERKKDLVSRVYVLIESAHLFMLYTHVRMHVQEYTLLRYPVLSLPLRY